MNIRWNIFLAVILLVLLSWFYTLHREQPDLSELIKAPESPEYIGRKMETTVFSPTGRKQYLAISEQVEYFAQDGRTEFHRPIVYVLEETRNSPDSAMGQSWKLSADKATLSKNNMLNLDGNVIAQSLLADSRLQRVETERATVNLTTQDISSDTMAKINGLNFTSSGRKLTGNLKQQVATLKEQVKTHYEISNQ
ncbi:lipopolysaccharide export system protein LptC [Mesocricetibacter intestinalis]|uniref:Lipopolysaccharide export system protein LptC n=1 Tax=Mesocricetibacter intestinalis TaxID=1521930 RepID=A0A4R6VCF6_9PAST|nr:LPS export ABC transporter periplasmic protein LptC [Mesocricetibacter intestinalis]TDQ57915.1 lipopolysaccharide export system protein LptC [Mesocricetibacter intestinalis]